MTAEMVMHPSVPVVRVRVGEEAAQSLFCFKPNVLLTKAQLAVLFSACRKRGLPAEALLASLAAEALSHDEMVDAVLGDCK